MRTRTADPYRVKVVLYQLSYALDSNDEVGTMNDEVKAFVFTSSFRVPRSLGLLVSRVLTAATAELAELQPLGRGLFILRRHVVAALAHGALQRNVIARHNNITLHLRLSKPGRGAVAALTRRPH